ncbi:MAG: translation elongation factor Ts [Armatimonadota bacterium]|nr:translation elongation factor Ts [Armatimonadota bacterium]MDR5675131.1 translation elongation factor Ts [Armatimonadota bacterium]MDR7387017.1 translation elongation factor Ts [Armatimonadota bacterium]MDR7388578.1 translation elongation factor Ts [Armatimonadota bacterium]MDR7391090.1 translation elongation factor Ts [Armatimonadota bacterium]
MAVSLELVKELRARTGAGMMDCKGALEEAGGDLERAVELLRKRGLAQAAKRAGRAATQGLVDAYIHGGGSLGVLVEVNCETDFVARTEEFRQLVRDLALQIAARDPRYVRREDVPEAELEREREIARAQLAQQLQGKPPAAVERAVEGKLGKWLEEVVLLEQPFIRDESKKVRDRIAEVVARTGENIVVRRFARFKLGEAG